MKPPLSLLVIARLSVLLLLLVGAACGGNGNSPPPSATTKPLPQQVVIAAEPDGITLEDPRFDPLPGARAYYGRLGGTVYRIEIPDHWNGALVLYLHGVRIFNPVGRAEDPPMRGYLVRNGFAWAASSFGSTSLIPGRAADETAALWDHFAAEFGRPQLTYLYGESMGGAGALISAERYGDRYDGVLAMCAYAGQSAEAQFLADDFSAAAVVAGVTQPEFDANASDVNNLINTRILPVLNDPAKHRLFEELMIDLTGGPRALDHDGLNLEETNNWSRAATLVGFGLVSNSGRIYQLDSSAGMTSEEFNRRVVRLPSNPELVKTFTDGNELTGELQLPTLTVHTTGDMFVPISQEQILRHKVNGAGKGGLLVQQAVQAPNHCGFMKSEREQALQALVDWVEHGQRPVGEDVLAGDLTHLGESFTAAPRLGSPDAGRVTGASERRTVEGQVLLDGKPLNNASVWVQVLNNGLWQSCSFAGAPTSHGRYSRVVAADSEVKGCGAPGAKFVVGTVKDGRTLVSAASDWPVLNNTVALDVQFATDTAPDPAGVFTRISGEAIRASGIRLPPGTEIAAYIGDAICGRTSIPYVPMQYGAPDQFSIIVAGPDVRAACGANAPIVFKVDGVRLPSTESNSLDSRNHDWDLVELPG